MAKRAKAEAAKRAKTEKVEPFFRPFSRLAAKGGSTKPPEKKTTGAQPSAQPLPLPRPRREEPAPPVEPVDPQTFAVYMAGVAALPEDRAHRIPRTASRLERAPRGAVTEDLDAEARARMRSLVTEGLRFETLDDGERIEGRRLDVEPREVRRLRRGQYATDGTLDLHGLGADEARKTVEAFVRKRAVDGDKVVLIVHGKGSHSPRGHGVLRGEIAAWLSQGRVARHVAAFATAPDERGGAGAVLVLLAR
jgi:DNA-nicking Smr family endonuclease